MCCLLIRASLRPKVIQSTDQAVKPGKLSGESYSVNWPGSQDKKNFQEKVLSTDQAIKAGKLSLSGEGWRLSRGNFRWENWQMVKLHNLYERQSFERIQSLKTLTQVKADTLRKKSILTEQQSSSFDDVAFTEVIKSKYNIKYLHVSKLAYCSQFSSS